jgi:hypothetical protein
MKLGVRQHTRCKTAFESMGAFRFLAHSLSCILHLLPPIQVLVRKELFLVTCASSFVAGVLDVVQLAKCVVLMWPCLPQMMMLGPVVYEKSQKQQEQEQQRRQRRQRK